MRDKAQQAPEQAAQESHALAIKELTDWRSKSDGRFAGRYIHAYIHTYIHTYIQYAVGTGSGR